MEITIKITGEDILKYPDITKDIIDNLKTFSHLIEGTVTPAHAMAPPVMLYPAPTAPAVSMQTQVAPTQAMQSPAPTAPMQMPVPGMQSPIPTAAPTAQPAVYTLEQLSLAAAPLMDAGKTDALVALMQSFGVQALQQLPQEKYNDFAVAIRGMGAQI